MLKVNGIPIELTRFPDGALSFRLEIRELVHQITWNYEGDHECMALWNIVHHIRSHLPEANISLVLPYLPNARMDRVKHSDEVFTLKWFAIFLNSLDFYCVYITDPHSNVGVALIDRAISVDISRNVARVLDLIDSGKNNTVLCYPDEGATKKYSEQIEGEYIFGIKHRDWRTGAIERLELTNPDLVTGRTVLIVDDICSRGGTFLHTAKALKEAGAGKVYLYVTHCENTIFQGELLNSGLIEHIFTTDSIYHGAHESITVL